MSASILDPLFNGFAGASEKLPRTTPSFCGPQTLGAKAEGGSASSLPVCTHTEPGRRPDISSGSGGSRGGGGPSASSSFSALSSKMSTSYTPNGLRSNGCGLVCVVIGVPPPRFPSLPHSRADAYVKGGSMAATSACARVPLGLGQHRGSAASRLALVRGCRMALM